MTKKSISQKRAERQKQESLALKRVFNVFLWGLAAECWLLIVYRFFIASGVDAFLAWYDILDVLEIAGLAVFVIGAVAAFLKRGNKKLLKPLATVSAIGLFFFASGFLATNFTEQGVTVSCIVVPVLTVLGLIYYLYQHECFLATLALTGALLTVWVAGHGVTGTWKVLVLVCVVVAIALLAALAAVLRTARKNNGKIKGVALVSVDCDYRVLYAVLAVAAVAVILALAVSSLSYYLMWALGVLLFLVLVFYTTKLM